MKSLSEIVDTIRNLKSLSSDAEVAILLGIKPKTLATAKLRNSIPYMELTSFCNQEGLSLNWLLTGEGSKYRADKGGAELQKEPADFVFVPMVRGEISAGGGLVPDDSIEIRIAFRKDWIQRRGDPKKMSLIRVSGDSMEPTLSSGDTVLVDHSHDYIDPQGGIHAITIDGTIMIKRLQVLYPSKKVRIISDNQRYETIETDVSQVSINGKVIWFGREIER